MGTIWRLLWWRAQSMLSLLNLIILTYLSIRLVKDDDSRNRWTLKELAKPYAELTMIKGWIILKLQLKI